MSYKFLKITTATFILALIGVVSVLGRGASAVDADISWTRSSELGFMIDSEQKDPSASPTCVPGKYVLGSDIVMSDVCVTDRGTWRFGQYKYYAPGSSYNETGYAIAFGDDKKMYRVRGLDNPVTLSNSNAMVYKTELSFFDIQLNVVRNFPSKLHATKNYINGAVEYQFDQVADLTLKRPNGSGLNTIGTGVSSNGKWLAAELTDVGIVRIDLETLDVKRVSSNSMRYWRGTNPSVEFAVSNDGRNIAYMGRNFFTGVVEVTDGCGDIIGDDTNSTVAIGQPCSTLDLFTHLQDKLPGFKHAFFPTFDQDSVRLNFFAELNDYSQKWVTMTASGFNPPARLDYVALGDSYSSGEGDTEVNSVTKQKYYLPGTDVEGRDAIPDERCHVSTRSYPFLLRDAMSMPTYLMKSIACSGAVGREDYAQSNDGYDGQNGRLDVLGSQQTIDSYKTMALNELIPGRNQQIEFVKKYQPKAITLTAGGNDVGFGEVAAACAMPSISCEYSRTDKGKARLGSAISKQYEAMTQLYKKLHEASPSTKIYVIGYPQFMSDENFLCAANVRFNPDERSMARAAVTYLNDVIESAANSAGATYIDIEDSLGSHILCDSEQPFITGLAMSGKWTDGIREMFSPESFHPNAKGHQAIFEAIQNKLNGQSLVGYSHCSNPTDVICPNTSTTTPQPVPYFADAMSQDPTNYSPLVMLKKAVQKGKDMVSIRLSNLEPNTLVDITVFSDPISLGTYPTNSSGKLSVDIAIPDLLLAGFHTLELAAKTFSGEPITYWQIIEVHGRAGDIDENGTADNTQQCLFIPPADIDYDGDKIDDACDLEIGPAAVIETTSQPVDNSQPPHHDQSESSQAIGNTLPTSVLLASGESRTLTPAVKLFSLLDTNLVNVNMQAGDAIYQSDENPNHSNTRIPLDSVSSQPNVTADQPNSRSSAALYMIMYAILIVLILALLLVQWFMRKVDSK